MMTKSEFLGNIDSEQKRISTRCVEIDDAISRLEEERRLMRERTESLETVRELYLRTEMSLQEIRQSRSEPTGNGSSGVEPQLDGSVSEDQLLSHTDLANN